MFGWNAKVYSLSGALESTSIVHLQTNSVEGCLEMLEGQRVWKGMVSGDRK